MADIEKELKKVRDEAAQRRVELAPYKKAFESFDEEAVAWLLDTISLINDNPYEAGERFATLAVGNMGEDGFTAWAKDIVFDDDDNTVANTTNIGENNKMEPSELKAELEAFEERLLGQINQNKAETQELLQEQQKREQFREITAIVTDLGYEPESWQGKMLIQVASGEVDANMPIKERLGKAHEIVSERLGTATQESSDSVKIGNAEVSSDPLNVPATGGQVGGGGIPNAGENVPLSFNDADDALMTLLKSEIGQ
mgnify:FL=1|tara:strand:+ start:127 stop:894 length:768 start_codon:yes stop_codon:yes gene_type:complete